MLVLSRKLNQSIQIGSDVTISIISVKGNTVRLGITAPDSVRVLRGELVKTPAGEDKATTAPSPDSNSDSQGSDAESPAGVVHFQSAPDRPVSMEIDRRLPKPRAAANRRLDSADGHQAPLARRMPNPPPPKPVYEVLEFRVAKDAVLPENSSV